MDYLHHATRQPYIQPNRIIPVPLHYYGEPITRDEFIKCWKNPCGTQSRRQKILKLIRIEE